MRPHPAPSPVPAPLPALAPAALPATILTLLRVLLLALPPAGSTLLGAQTEPEMAPFTMNPRAARAPSPVDLSFLLDAPAGRHGFLVVRDGHLATAQDGGRIRLWGVNITDWSRGSRQIPAKEDAAYIAGTLARFGVNCVRLQFLDLEAPRGLIAPGENTRTLDPDQLDREDYLIAALERRGIYIDLNLLVGRPFKGGDGVHDASGLREGAKGTSLFDARMIELQREYARQLLDHRNPYTGRRYTADPGVAIVEINNENAIGIGYHAPSSFYGEELTALYNRWLAGHRTPGQIEGLRRMAYARPGDPVPLMSRRGEPSAAPPERLYAEAEFFAELERDYFEQMRDYLRQTLGVRSLIIATADHSHSGSGYPILMATQGMDIVDGHTYWEHPGEYGHKLPMVDDPLNSTVVELSRSAVALRPYTVSEVNHPFPSDYAGEGIPILAAYGAFQDWDGIFWYTFEPKADPAWRPYVGDPFDISLDPVKMPELAAGALLFLRGDVERARQVAARTYTRQQVFDSILLPPADRPLFTPGLAAGLALEHGMRIGSLNGPPAQTAVQTEARTAARTSAQGVYASDTGQLHWYAGGGREGVVTVDAPRSQALIGFLGAGTRSASNLAAQVDAPFCQILLAAMDEAPIAASGRLLLVTGSTVRNTGQRWNSAGTDVTAWGESPTLIRPVRGTVILRGIRGARSVLLQPIDGAGQPLGRPISAVRSGAEWRLPVGTVATTWYLVTVVRPDAHPAEREGVSVF